MVEYLSGGRIQGSSLVGDFNTCTGYTDDGYDPSIGTYLRVCKITATVSGSVTSLSCDLQNATGNVALGLYADNSGVSPSVPNARLGYTASTAVVAGVNTVALISPVSVTNGTVYWISIETSASNSIKLAFGNASGTSYYYSRSYGTPPDPFPSASVHTTGFQVCLVAAGTDEKVAITDVPTGSRYEETDTRKIYRYKDGYSGTNFNETFPTTGHGWTLNATYASISSNTLRMQQASSDTGGNASRAYKALTTSVTYANSEKMVIDFDWKRNDDSNGSKYTIIIISSAQTGYADPTNGHRQIAMILGEADVRGYFKYNDGSAYESSDGFGSLQPADNTWRYYRMIVSKAASGYTWKVYTSDANRAADTSAEDTLVVNDIPDAWWGSSQPTLAYWQVAFPSNQTSGSYGHTLDSYFDNLKITQDSLTVPAKEWKEKGT